MWKLRFSHLGQRTASIVDLEQLLQLYRLHRPQLADSTADQYHWAVRSLEKHLGRMPTTDDLTEDSFLAFLSARLGTAGTQTVKRERASLLTLWRFAARKRLVDVHPASLDLPPIRIKRNPPVALTPEQMRAIIASCLLERGRMPHGPLKADWWRSLVLVLYCTGARVSAILACERSDLSGNMLLLRAEHSKTGVGQWHLLPDYAISAIEKMDLITGDRIWEWPFGRRQLWRAWKRIVTRAGLPDSRRYGFHAIRRTTATLMAIATSIEVARLALGHSSQSMTECYIDPRVTSTCVAESLPRI
jgi:integrase